MITGRDLTDLVIERTRHLASIPAPSFHEGDRAEVVHGWWASQFDEVILDDVGNVWAHACHGSGPALVIAAHMDTVFDTDISHTPERREDRLYGPSVGDDSVAVAALAAVAELLPADCANVWILATIGEEGLGNLAGITHALESPQTPIGAVIAVEGNWLGRVCVTAVGSIRYRVTLTGPGGHAWEASDVDSAIHAAARIIAVLDQNTLPSDARCSLNVGTISGGTAINARADRAVFDIDLRSDEASALADLDRSFRSVVELNRGQIDAKFDPLGNRPAGSIAPSHALPQAALDALADAGVESELTAASTDANAAHAAAIPAIAVGITRGAQEHTTNEWIDLPPIAIGLEVLARTVLNYTRSSQ
ncbi:MAG: M20/M25/M40 family metallo-hydrolase [Actinobacteria bacterium]|nr:M20/M25/M40 family metallo-hydrolase [Actinomycetota bacterium]